MRVTFYESPAFDRKRESYLGTAGFDALTAMLNANPEAGDVIPGTGGVRKVRMADPRRGKGTRGGLRVIYVYFPEYAQVHLIAVYAKNEVADLTPAEKKAMREFVKDLPVR